MNTSTTLTTAHIEMLLRLDNVSLSFKQLSATRQKLVLALVGRGLAESHPENDDVVIINARGLDLLGHLVEYMNDWMCAT